MMLHIIQNVLFNSFNRHSLSANFERATHAVGKTFIQTQIRHMFEHYILMKEGSTSREPWPFFCDKSIVLMNGSSREHSSLSDSECSWDNRFSVGHSGDTKSCWTNIRSRHTGTSEQQHPPFFRVPSLPLPAPPLPPPTLFLVVLDIRMIHSFGWFIDLFIWMIHSAAPASRHLAHICCSWWDDW